MGRQRFVFNLSALGVAIMLVLAAVAFGPHAAKWVGLGIGITGLALILTACNFTKDAFVRVYAPRSGRGFLLLFFPNGSRA